MLHIHHITPPIVICDAACPHYRAYTVRKSPDTHPHSEQGGGAPEPTQLWGYDDVNSAPTCGCLWKGKRHSTWFRCQLPRPQLFKMCQKHGARTPSGVELACGNPHCQHRTLGRMEDKPSPKPLHVDATAAIVSLPGVSNTYCLARSGSIPSARRRGTSENDSCRLNDIKPKTLEI